MLTPLAQFRNIIYQAYLALKRWFIGKNPPPGFTDEVRILFVKRVKISILVMSLPLILLFHISDRFFAPDQVWLFFKIRLLVVPMAAISVLLYHIKIIRERFYLYPAFFFNVYLSLYTVYLIQRTGLEKSSYYAGLNLVSLGSMAFLPWNLPGLVVYTAVTYFPYFCLIFLSFSAVKLSFLVPNLFFILSTIFIGFITNLDFRNLRVSAALNKFRLEQDNINKIEIINEKTNQGIYLEKLARQFPMSVMERIKSGKLSINSIQRKEVTIVFFDVKSSTERSSKLDYNAYLEVLIDCYTNIGRILIENGVTRSTFTGDGQLGFTNAPESHADHRKICLDASMKALKFCLSRSRFYSEKWQKPFEMKIGIHTGFAHVGFFPNDEFGSYTVVDANVNQAARYCSNSLPNTITVDKTFLKSIGDEIIALNVDVTRLDAKKEHTKGMEDEEFELFSLVPRANEEYGDRMVCPLCGKKLRVSADLGNIILLKCYDSCRFTDMIEKGSA